MLNFRGWLVEATTEYTPRPHDPALMTWDEFRRSVDRSGKYHRPEAYDWSVKQLNQPSWDWTKRPFFTELIGTKTFRGIPLEFRLAREGSQGKRVSLGVFNPERECVGYTTDDEWGCMLVVVAREYRGFGFGNLLTKLAYEHSPGRDTGGMTDAGKKSLFRAYQEWVREYLQKGFYSKLVKGRQLTVARVQEIVASARLKGGDGWLDRRTQRPQTDLYADPDGLELYHEDGCFIVYHRKLRELLQNHDYEDTYWTDRMVNGLAYVGSGYNDHQKGILWRLGADTPQLKQFLLRCAVSWCHNESVPLLIHKERWADVDRSYVDLDEDGMATLKGQPVAYDPIAAGERRWRRSFDKYDEFKSQMVELAYGKFGDD